MASESDLEALHRAADIPDDDDDYPDDLLAEILDAETSVAAAAAVIWREKAAALAAMVDTTESGSSRKLSDLHANALAMAKGFQTVVADTAIPTRRSFTTQIERL